MTISLTGVSRDAAFDGALGSLRDASFASRLFSKDTSLWGAEAAVEAAVRLGWTDFEGNASEVLAATEDLRRELLDDGIDSFVLCGMGGSSLAPLMIAPALRVLDSTHPDTVRAALEGDLSRTAVIVSSKSGGTVETMSQMRAFEAAFVGAGVDPAGRIIVVTDPGSALEDAATRAGHRVFNADPSVGGRFSVFTAFGIVPSVLAGADMQQLVADAAGVRDELALDSGENPGLVLAAALAAHLPERFVAELTTDGTLPAEFGLWIEQLVAESTGKDGKGVFPIALPAGATPSGASSATLVRLGAAEALGNDGRSSDSDSDSGIGVFAPLGAQLLLWQVATAAMGFLVGVDPFNQPDVEAAKIATRESLGAPAQTSPAAPAPAEIRARLRELVLPEGYLAVQAYVDSGDPELAGLLVRARQELSAELGVPVALGYGPRYLHSTGQFHKGGPACGTFLQIIGVDAQEVAIPGEEAGFGALLEAQAHGDASVLRERGRDVVSVETQDPVGFLRGLLARG
ncbi:glucose-6-phosphate isomerase [Leucobacter komagatae]|uniref:Glucose-6-phosphate isomerase n=1 Tax=Leucobacter komagatae TaxID=55969 RepID=A0A542Y308_9MICO|nr:glucose-6-phosphate isomerase [Leucobacter komagatae]TQL42456.1 glucose-6-phosphate isomerase [Leucobacter komagatae]